MNGLLSRLFRSNSKKSRRTKEKALRRRKRISVEALEDRCLLSVSAGLPSMVDYGRLPMVFEANQGQAGAEMGFLSRGLGYALLLQANEATLSLRSSSANAGSADSHGAILQMQLVGGNPTAQGAGVTPLLGKSHYLIGNHPDEWTTNVQQFNAVRYDDVYAGVDVVYYGNQRQLEYDLIVAPGADPAAITLAFEGAGQIEVDDSGDLVLDVGGEELRFPKPIVYQERDGERHEIDGTYRLDDNGQVGFQVAAYDPSVALVIDPLVVYATYLGGSGLDIAYDIAVDSAGNAYVVGDTQSVDFSTTPGALQGTKAASTDLFVTKLDPTGQTALFSTYLGGSSSDQGRGIALDSAGNIYITGTTQSTDFPTTEGAFKPAKDGFNQEVFVTKLDPTGSTILYSTYIGGADARAQGIAVNSAGNAYVVGENYGSFPTTASAFQTSERGGNDVFVLKLSANGGSLLYSTFAGGNANDYGDAIAVDAAGIAYVTGATNSFDTTVPGFPTTPGAFKTTKGAGYDSFLLKIDPSQTGAASLVYGTLIGGDSDENVTIYDGGVAVDAAGHVYVTGSTASASFPITAGAYKTTPESGEAFVIKIDPSAATAAQIVYSTFLGGASYESGNDIAVDADGRALITGYTLPGFPTTAGAFQENGTNSADGFLAVLDASGSQLVYGSFLGGPGGVADQGFGVAVNLGGSFAYIVGQAGSEAFPTTPGVFQANAGGGGDGFVARLDIPATETQMDFGDAPDSYGTLLSSDGARHAQTPRGLFLGTTFDAEPDGQPVPPGFGDDNAGFDDEDGVTIQPLTTSLSADMTATVDVFATGDGLVDAWIDFNGNGFFDPAEKLGGGVSIPVPAFVTTTIPITVPAGSFVGPTYARFRLSSAGGLEPTGPADDGEVEDYEVVITEDAITVTQVDSTLTIVGTRGGQNISITDHGDRNVTVTTAQNISITYQRVERVRLDLGERDRIHYDYRGGPGGTPVERQVIGFPIADYGDAPAPYADAGHLGWNALLGSLWENEPGSQPNADALGDDNDGFDDEDGVTLPAYLIAGEAATIEIVASQAGRLNAWVDYNADGDWADEGEQILTDFALVAGSQAYTMIVPDWAVPAEKTYARFRVNTAGGISYDGLALDGEVEDYAVSIHGKDYGDAPDSYGTLLSSDGARHAQTPRGLFLGTTFDAEPDGQPVPPGFGDDNAGFDDEDGVTIPPLTTNPSADMTATVDVFVTGDGLIDAWIDFNGNGFFDPAEKLGGGVSIPVSAFVTTTIPITVPAGSFVGPTYARFRLSSTGGLGPTGPADDGEVEDYEVRIASAGPERGRIAGRKFADLDGNGMDDGEPGLSGWTITLDADADGAIDDTAVTGADGSYSFDVLPGLYRLREQGQSGWTQTTPDPADITLLGGQAVIAVDFGNFRNVPVGGSKFHDANANGRLDDGEGFLANWLIHLDLGSDGRQDRSVRTDANGVYVFEDVGPGTHTFSEEQDPRYRQTLPASAGTYRVSPTSGVAISGLLFGNVQLGRIEGQKFEDLDGDGVKDPGEPGLEGWTIHLDKDGNGTVDYTTTTGPDGIYVFQDLLPGTYELAEVQQDGWLQTTPAALEEITFGGVVTQVLAEDPLWSGVSVDDLWSMTYIQDSTVLDAAPNPQVGGYTGAIAAYTLTIGSASTSSPFPDHIIVYDNSAGEDMADEYRITSPISSDSFYYPDIVLRDATGEAFSSDALPDCDELELSSFASRQFSFYRTSPAVNLFGGTVNSLTCMGGTGIHSVVLGAGDVVGDRDFGNVQLGEIHGEKYHDLNANHLKDPDEPGLPGWTITLDQAADGSIDFTTTTDANGNYSFAGLLPGNYFIDEVQQSGWAQTAPVLSNMFPPPLDSVPVSPYPVVLHSGSVREVDFGNIQLARIHGNKFHDENANRVWDASEPGLDGWTIEIRGRTVAGAVIVETAQTVSVDANNDGRIEGREMGAYSFRDLMPGTYTLSEEVRAGWMQTTPGGLDVDDYPLILTGGDDRGGLDFGNVQLATIRGQKFHDLDADGVKDATDPGLDNWRIILNGTTAAGDPVADFATTHSEELDGTPGFDPFTEQGLYEFKVLPGTYVLSEFLLSGWLQTAPQSVPPGTHTVTIAAGQTIDGRDFGNTRFGRINGQKFEDLDGDGFKDANEPGLPGWTITLDTNGDGSVDATTVTGPDGSYSFVDLVPGEYQVDEVQQPGWQQTAPAPIQAFAFSGVITHLFSAPADAPWNAVNVGDAWSLIYVQDAAVADSDPDPQVGEYGGALASYTLTIGAGTTSSPYPNVILVHDNSALGFLGDTYALGSFASPAGSFFAPHLLLQDLSGQVFSSDLLPACDELDLSDFSKRSFRPVTRFESGISTSHFQGTVDSLTCTEVVGPQTVVLVGGQVATGIDFGNRRILDFGDAPDDPPTFKYPTLLEHNGARHALTSPLFLGSGVDHEPNGLPSLGADGDDLSGGDDEDGVTLPAYLIAGEAATIEIVASQAGRLNAWVDYNADGDWADEGEQIFTDFALVAGSQAYTMIVPDWAVPAEKTYARFRVNTAGGISYDGLALDGEVEDYAVSIHGRDFGDAPDSYGTLLSSDGPRHEFVVGGLRLGVLLDSDVNGQPTMAANGDDNLGDDDEDGVTFTSALLTNPTVEMTGTVDVVASAAGLLDAWIDFNANGIFGDDPKENLSYASGGGSISIAAGTNTIAFQIPAGSVANTPTYARFRISSTGGLGPTGAADDGEVEDHLIEGIAADIPTVTQVDGHLTITGTQGGSRISITDDGNRSITVTTNNTISITYDGVDRVRLDLGERDRLVYRYVGGSSGTPVRREVIGFVIRDYGDAPLPYPVAGHGFGDIFGVGGPILGEVIDTDPGSQPHAEALGDDLESTDDEDGVVFAPQILGSQEITAFVTVAAPGFLDAWMDFNGDGDWDDPGEQIATSVSVSAGVKSLPFSIATSTGGLTFGRFRVSSSGGLSPGGSAEDGEVEDHTITIDNGSLTNITFDDANANGVRERGERGMDGIIVEVTNTITGAVIRTQSRTLDRDNDGRIDPDTEVGVVHVGGLTRGTYEVRQLLEPPRVQTRPAGDAPISVTITSSGEQVRLDDFGSVELVTIRGNVFHDLNGNNVNEREPGLAGFTVELIDPSSGRVVATTRTVETTPYNATFVVPAGRYLARIVAPLGWLPTSPNNVFCDPSTPFESAWVHPERISGQKYHDKNANGQRDPGEEGLDGWSILFTGATGLGQIQQVTTTTKSVDLNGDGVIDPMTEMGLFEFTGKAPGQYTVEEIAIPDGWKQSAPEIQYARLLVDSFGIDTHVGPLKSFVASDGDQVDSISEANLHIEPFTGSSSDVFHYQWANGRFNYSQQGTGTANVDLVWQGAGFPFGFGLDVEGSDPNLNFVYLHSDANVSAAATLTLYSSDTEYSSTDIIPIGNTGGLLISLSLLEPGPNGPADLSDVTKIVLHINAPFGAEFHLDELGFVNRRPAHSVEITSEQPIEGLMFGNYQPAPLLQGFHYLDVNGDGQRQAGEAGLDGWEVQLVDAATGRILERTTTGAIDVDGRVEHGVYSFREVDPGRYQVRLGAREGWIQTQVPETFVLTSGVPFSDVLAFGSFELGTITGQTYEDRNGNGRKDSGEPGQDGWRIELIDPRPGMVVASTTTMSLDSNGDGRIDPEMEMGWYEFNVPRGDYEIRQFLPAAEDVTIRPAQRRVLPTTAHFFEIGRNELLVQYAVNGATIMAYQEGRDARMPLGEAVVIDGAAVVKLTDPPDPGLPILMSASHPDADSVMLRLMEGLDHPQLDLTSSTLDGLAGMARFPAAILLDAEGGGERFTQLLVPGVESRIGEPGMPAVPVYRRLIALPQGVDAADVVVTVGSTRVAQVLSDVNLYPFQNEPLDEDDPEEDPDPLPPASEFEAGPFVKDADAYASRSPLPSVRVVPAGNYRYLNLALVEIATAQYVPATRELTVYESIAWNVSFADARGADPAAPRGFLPARALSPFENNAATIYGAVLNRDAVFENIIPDESLVKPLLGEEYMILTYPDFRTAADQLAAWKNSTGIVTRVFEVGAGTEWDTKEEIKALIQSHYDDGLIRPSYVLLLGDTEFIPTWYVNVGNVAKSTQDQDVNSGMWNTLGTVHFAGGGGEGVRLTRLERDPDVVDSGLTSADAVRFVNVETSAEFIVDNLDDGFSTTGFWAESGADDEYLGSSLATFQTDAVATWTANLPEGFYEVFVRWSGIDVDSGPINRDSIAQYQVFGGITGSDVPYAILGGFLDFMPDVGLGRMPVDSLAQAQVVVDKTIQYEQNPPASASFYANASVASSFEGFQSGTPLGRDQRAFIEGSEDTRNTLQSYGYAVQRIYSMTDNDPDDDNDTPLRYVDGSLLPADLGGGSGFAWDGDAQDVVNAFNAGRFLITHRDHAGKSGWSHPGFDTGNIKNDLTNGDLLPFVYSINCSSGLFDNETSGSLFAKADKLYFAERLLRQPGQGAVGVIAASRNSPTWANSGLYRGLIDATWTDDDPAFGGGSSIHRLGDILNYGKGYLLSHIGAVFGGEVDAQAAIKDLYLFNVFGDPTLGMWTFDPTQFLLQSEIKVQVLTSSGVGQDFGGLALSYAIDGATITAYQDIGAETRPLGRAEVREGRALLPFVTARNPATSIHLVASMPNAVSVELQPQEVWHQMLPENGRPYVVSITQSGQIIEGQDFGNVAIRDYGDAPSPYPEARHGFGDILGAGGPILGTLIDTDLGNQPHPQALGDDLASIDDEDGVQGLPSLFTIGEIGDRILGAGLVSGESATVDVTAAAPGRLDAWIDYNDDGDWDDPGEQIFTNLAVSAGVNSLNFTVGAAPLAITTFARFRISSAGGLSPGGFAPDGEVEDYQVHMNFLDFGDAPESYPTAKSNNGAAHFLIPEEFFGQLLGGDLFPEGGFFLGASVDADSDGQPTADATGDDNDGNDDEDGVVFLSPLIPGKTAAVSVTASSPGFLSAWVDFNSDGDWNDPADEIAWHGDGTLLGDKFLVKGNNILTFTVPITATPASQTFARFRYSPFPIPGPAGLAFGGEVEDYAVTIKPTAFGVFDQFLGVLIVNGTEEGDDLDLTANDFGQIQIFSNDNGRSEAPIFDAAGRLLDPRGGMYPTISNTRDIQVRLGDGDDFMRTLADRLGGIHSTVHGQGGDDEWHYVPTGRLIQFFEEAVLDSTEWTVFESGPATEIFDISLVGNPVVPPDPEVRPASGHLNVSVFGSDRPDTFNVKVSGAIQDALNVNVQAGDGVDTVNVIVQGPWRSPATITVDGGAGNDTLSSHFIVAPGAKEGDGGVRVAAGDVSGDGVADIITAPGPDDDSLVRVSNGATGAEISHFLAYPGFTGGVFVAAGDVNGDGKADIITGADAGAAPHVKVFDGDTGALIHSFFAYDSLFAGGVRVAAGDVNGDGKADIITGAGPGAGPHVKVFDGATLAPIHSFFAYDVASAGGVYVAAGDVNGDGKADIITGAGPGASPEVKVFDGSTLAAIHSFCPFDMAFGGGVHVAAGDVNGDGKADIIAGQGPGGSSRIKSFDGSTLATIHDLQAFAPLPTGVFIAAGDVNNDGRADLVAGTDAGVPPQVKVFDSSGAEFLSPMSTINISMNGGGGDDTITAVVTGPPDDTMPWSGRLDLSAFGGEGNDRLAFRADNLQLAGGQVNVTLDGGAGNDFVKATVPLKLKENADYALSGGQGLDHIEMQIVGLSLPAREPSDGALIPTANFGVDGGSEDDEIIVTITGSFAGAVNLNVQGGGGNNTIRARVDNVVVPQDGSLRVDLRAGDGNDEAGHDVVDLQARNLAIAAGATFGAAFSNGHRMDVTVAGSAVIGGMTLTEAAFGLSDTTIGVGGELDVVYLNGHSLDVHVAGSAVIGALTLTDAASVLGSFTLTNVLNTLSIADTTIGEDGTLTAAFTGQGQFNLKDLANETRIAGFSAHPSFSGDDLAVTSALAISNVPAVPLEGTVDHDGQFSLVGTARATLAGFALEPIFTLTNASLSAVAGFDVPVVGRVDLAGNADAGGRFHLTGAPRMTVPEGTSIRLPDPVTEVIWSVTKDGVAYDSARNSVVLFTPDDNGLYGVEVLDDIGHSLSMLFGVHNATPTASITGVAQPTAAFIVPRQTLTFFGSWTDPGILDSQTVTWSFGDGGSATQRFGPGGSARFFAEHAYAAPGTYTVTLQVTDKDGGVGTARLSVVVHTPLAATDVLRSSVQNLTQLNQGERKALTNTLNAAMGSMNRGNTTSAKNQLGAFINQVKAKERSGQLSAAEVRLLTDLAAAIIAAL